MAFQLQVLTTYTGKYASYFWVPATFSMDTINKGAVMVQDGIKKEFTIPRIDYLNPLQPRVATPSPGASAFQMDGRTLQPNDIMVYCEFNPRDLETTFIAESLSKTLLDRRVPQTVESYMLQISLNRAFEQVEVGIWQGSTSYTAAPGSSNNGQICFFDGFLKTMINDTAVLQVSSPLPLAVATASGVYGVLDALDALITLAAANKKALLSNPNRYKRMKFFVSVATEQLYQAALVNLVFKGQATNEQGIKPWKGYQIITCAGMADNTIVFAEGLPDASSNLYVGMNSTEDEALKLAMLQNNSELFFIKGLFKFSTQYGFSQEVFLFTTLTSSTFTA